MVGVITLTYLKLICGLIYVKFLLFSEDYVLSYPQFEELEKKILQDFHQTVRT